MYRAHRRVLHEGGRVLVEKAGIRRFGQALQRLVFRGRGHFLGVWGWFACSFLQVLSFWFLVVGFWFFWFAMRFFNFGFVVFGFWVWGLGFEVLGAGCRGLSVGSRVSAFGFWGLGFWGSGFGI